MVLENLDAIPWADLKQAHGNAAHVAEAIRALESESARVRKEAYWKLDNHVVLQGDLYEAAAYVPPFLIAMLASSVRHGRELILDLLFEIGNGCCGPDERLRIRVDSAGQVSEYMPGDAPRLQRACREGVLAGVEYYLHELESPGPCNLAASQLVASLPEKEAFIRRGLERTLSMTQDERLRSIIGQTLVGLEEYLADYQHPDGEWRPWL